jgi:Uma2 family endonuclease
MGAAKTLLTAEQFDNYPFEEDKRYELDEGELIEMTRPAFFHNYILGNLFFSLTAFLRKSSLGHAFLSENLYALSPTVRRAPDVAIFLGNRLPELRDEKVITIIPDICVEILSPNERPSDIHRKLKQYFKAGVKEVWVIDPEPRDAEIWTGLSLPDRVVSGDDPLSSVLLPGFEVPLAELFQ